MGATRRPATTTVGVRISERERVKLDEFCRLTGQTRCQVVRTLIALAQPPRFEPVRLPDKEARRA